MDIVLGNTTITENGPVFIIAEAGVNHNGSLSNALDMVDIAARAGADAIKFQTFTAAELATSDVGLAAYAEQNLGGQERMVDMLAPLALAQEDFCRIKEHCEKRGIVFLSTPHTSDVVDFLDDLMPAYKLASGDITNIPLLEQVAHKYKPILLSTGMSTLEDVAVAVRTIRAAGNERVVLLHCTSLYPCRPTEVNLRAMETMRRAFGLPVGFSDHTMGMDAATLAAWLGAVVIEKHFTLDRRLRGPDHAASLEPAELASLVQSIRNKNISLSFDREVLLGSAKKIPVAREREVAEIARKSIVASRDIAKGETITMDMLCIKRPGTGLTSARLNDIIGKCALRHIAINTLLLESDI